MNAHSVQPDRDLARLIEPLARHFWGEPNKRLCKQDELRFGTHGARSVSIEKGVWHDHEKNIGGGVLDLVGHETGVQGADRFTWLHDHGFDHGEQPKRAKSKKKIVATFDYTSESNELLFQVVKYEPKAFKQRKPDGNGGWQWTVKGVRQVPYRLQELQAAITEGRDVFICEGEKDADRLRAGGVTATTNPGGACKWPFGFREYFELAERVIILPDNDDAGRNHVQVVGRSLAGTVADLRVLELPDLKHKQDVSDWLDDHSHTIEELLELVATKARPFEVEASESPDDAPPTQPDNDTDDDDDSEVIPERRPRRRKRANDVEAPAPRGRPVIRVTGGGLSKQATLGEKAIIDAGELIFANGERLVRPVIREVEASDRRMTKVASLLTVDLPYLRDLNCRTAGWERFDGRSQEWVKINPPPDVAKTILSRQGEWLFKPVVGVISTPTLRPDGSILSAPGYDAETRMLLVEPPPLPEIPDAPTRDDALTALKLLKELISECSFVDGSEGPSRSVALSALITPVVRPLFPVAPLHAVTAPVPGTGKSYLFDIAAAIALGQDCPVISAGKTEEELEKRLNAALMTSQPIISIDNIDVELTGAALCQATERPVIDVRVLGKSKFVRVEARATLFANGNNLVLVGDLTRRVIMCSLDAERERPELRTFKRDPVADVMADRGKYIAAAITVVRGYIVAGRPNPPPTFASFRGWSNSVRGALIWLGCEDPVATVERARAQDPSQQTREALFAELQSIIGKAEQARTAAQIVAAASSGSENLREALHAVAGNERGEISTKRFGKWLAKQRARIAVGLRLEGAADDHGHAIRWWLRQIKLDTVPCPEQNPG